VTERLSDIAARLDTVKQLSAVITAMRGIAVARTREAQNHLDSIRSYARTVADAIATSLQFVPEPERSIGPKPLAGSHTVIVLCSEQGFVGTFNERVLDATSRLVAAGSDDRAEILLAGDRGLMLARERGIAPAWTAAMIAHAGQATSLADRLVEELYGRLEADHVTRVTIVHTLPGAPLPGTVVEKVLVPFDFARFPVSEGAAPLIGLPPQVLVAKLAEEYVFAELCEAIVLSYAAENEARMRAMIAARTNVAKKRDALTARYRQLRQEDITRELIELASGAQDALDGTA
jgi:F-type H+-transporting ATPase subunit gamma